MAAAAAIATAVAVATHADSSQAPLPPAPPSSSLSTADEKDKILQCEKLVQFRDDILAGSHPRIKPPNLAAKSATIGVKPTASSRASSTSCIAPTGSFPASQSTPGDNLESFQANSQLPSLPGLGKLITTNAVSSATLGGSQNGASRPTPQSQRSNSVSCDALSKQTKLSDEQIQKERQRLETLLKGELDRRRSMGKSVADQIVDFDLGDVLSRALILFEERLASCTNDAATAAADNGLPDVSESVDNDTFYSSRHHTPDPREPSPGAKSANAETDEHMRDASSYEPMIELDTILKHVAEQQNQNAAAAAAAVDCTNQHPEAIVAPGPHVPVPVDISRSEGSGQARNPAYRAHTSDSTSVDQTQLPLFSSSRPESIMDRPHHAPLIRAHNLSPVAPRPAHVSLTIPGAVTGLEGEERRATPAQVAALRRDRQVSSLETSPHASQAERRKQKRKRRAERAAAEIDPSPYIKPEPRSPSPLSTSVLTRPNKRHRQSRRQQLHSAAADPRHAGSVSNNESQSQPERYSPRRPFPDDDHLRRHPTDPRDDPGLGPPAMMPPPPPSRYDPRGYDAGPHEVTSSAAYARPPSPTHSGHHGTREGQSVRSVSNAYHPGMSHPGPASYSGAHSYPKSRMPSRPHADRERSRSPPGLDNRPRSVMAPRRVASHSQYPLPPPPPLHAPPPRPRHRIVVNEYGQEYYESVPDPSYAGGGGPPSHDTEIIYERSIPPHRAVSRLPETYHDDGVIYRRVSSPPYSRSHTGMVPVDAGRPEYPSYHERDYPARLPGPPGEEYVRVPVAGGPRDYLSRSASVRPPGESSRYDTYASYKQRPMDSSAPVGEYEPSRPGMVWPMEPLRYEGTPRHERRLVEEAPPPEHHYASRSASTRPVSRVRYEVPYDAAPTPLAEGSIYAEMAPRREYAPSAHPVDMRPEYEHRPGSGRGAMDPPPPIMRRDYSVPPPAPPTASAQYHAHHAPARREAGVVYVSEGVRGPPYQ